MAATPKNGTMIFRGLSTGQSYSIAFYNPDVAGSLVRFDAGAGAGAATPDYVAFGEPVQLEDVCVVTGIIDTTQLRIVANNAPTVQVLRWAQHLDSLANRPKLNIRFKAGTRVSAFCVA